MANETRTAGLVQEDVVRPEPIAIVGMGCRWPGGVRDATSLWELLRRKGSGYRDFGDHRFSAKGFYHPDPERPGTVSTKGGYLLAEDARLFDPSFFGIQPTEVETMDVAQRKLLEVVYEAFENAGETLESISGSRTGVFVGNFAPDHTIIQSRDPDYPRPYLATGVSPCVTSNRISYAFNLTGPSLMLDTACSSSMYALHVACSAIRNGDCDSAIVAASNWIMEPTMQLMMNKLGALSSTSACHTFDEAADGYARAEGFAALYLTKVRDAVEGEYPIRALIRGTAINANGRTGGITHPSKAGQEAVIRTAYQNAGDLPLSETSYFECHGTGTPVGDPIEISVIGNVFSSVKSVDNPLLVGSVKTNLGHSEAASAVAGIMKVVLALEAGVIPPSIGVNNLNSAIDFKKAMAHVVTQTTPWPADQLRRASINSFGFGGANGHCIIDHVSNFLPGYVKPGVYTHSGSSSTNGNTTNGCSAASNGEDATHDDVSFEKLPSSHVPIVQKLRVVKRADADARDLVLLPFSAHNEASLKLNISALANVIQKSSLADVAYTLGAKRTKFSQRTFRIVNRQDASQGLEQDQKVYSSPAEPARLGFIFTGQGAQWNAMGRELFEYRVFRDAIDYLDHVLAVLRTYAAQSSADWTIRAVLTGACSEHLINSPEVSQTVCTAIQIGIVDLLASWSIRATAVAGHSSGEMAAAYAAGRITAAESIASAYFRGQAVSKNVKQGAMLAVSLSLDEAQDFIEHWGQAGLVQVAAINSPSSTTLSGDAEAVKILALQLEEEGVFNRLLQTGGNAYHSHHMAALGAEYNDLLSAALTRIDELGLSGVNLRYPRIPWVSSVTPTKNPMGFDRDVDPSYWRSNLESPVRFSQAVTKLLTPTEADSLPVNLLVEIGPHHALKSPINQIVAGLPGKNATGYTHSLKRGEDSRSSLLQLAGTLFAMNYPVDISAVNSTDEQLRVGHALVQGCTLTDLPPYQYAYGPVRYHESRLSKELRSRAVPRHDLLGTKLPGNAKLHPQWRNILRLKDLGWLADHRLSPHAVFPAAGYIAMAMEAASRVHGELPDSPEILGFSLRNVAIRSALTLPEDDYGVEILLSMRLDDAATVQTPEWATFSISSVGRDTDVWTEHCTGKVKIELSSSTECQIDKIETHGMSGRPVNMPLWYAKYAGLGFEFRPAFQALSEVYADPAKNLSTARVDLRKNTSLVKGGESGYPIHPTSLDGLLQLAIVSFYGGQLDKANVPHVPIRIGELYLGNSSSDDTWGSAFAVGERRGLRGAYANAQLRDQSDRVVLDLKSLRYIVYTGESLATPEGGHQRDHFSSPFTRLAWKPDIRKLNSHRALTLFPPPQDQAVKVPLLDDFDTIATILVLDIYDKFAKTSDLIRETSSQARYFLEWVRRTAKREDATSITRIRKLSVDERTRLLEELCDKSKDLIEVQVAKSLHRSMEDILYGRRTGAEVLAEDDLLTALHESAMTIVGAYPQLHRVLECLGHANPSQNILELGTGTCGATRVAMGALHVAGASAFKRYKGYTLTGASPDLVASAQESMATFKDVAYSILDIDNDPLVQGHGPVYDLIIASQCLHTSPSISTALSHCRKLLRPGGKLVLVETTQDTVAHGLLFGLLPGYWNGVPDGRIDSPFLDAKLWNSALMSAGFSGTELSLQDYPSPHNTANVIVSTLLEDHEPAVQDVSDGQPKLVQQKDSKGNPRSVLLMHGASGPPPLLTEMFQELEDRGLAPTTLSLDDATDALKPGSHIIAFLEGEDLLLDIGGSRFATFQHMARCAASMVWITRCGIVQGKNPDGAVVTGLLRNLGTENPVARYLSIDIDPDSLEQDEEADLVRCIADKEMGLQQRRDDDESEDREFVWQQGCMWVSRIVPDIGLADEWDLMQMPASRAQPLPLQSQGPVRVDFETPGILSSLYFKPYRELWAPLLPGDIEVKVAAVGLNWKDLSISAGRYDANHFSSEYAGIVTKVGSAVEGFSIGDRVYGMGKGHFGTHTRVPGKLAQKLGPADDLVEAATMPLVFMTAVYAFDRVTQLKAGEKVLIQSASGGLGLAAIQVAQGRGAEVFATVGNAEKARFLTEAMGIPACHIFGSHEASEMPRAAAATGGRGFDVILSVSKGEILYESLKALHPLGRLIDVGRMDVMDAKTIGLELFQRSINFSSFDLGHVVDTDLDLAASLMEAVHQYHRAGIIGPVRPFTAFDVSQLDQVLLKFSKGTHLGKLVITYQDPDALVRMVPPVAVARFDPAAIYIVTGGLGGLGRSIIRWMADRGAQNVTVLSRSGSRGATAAARGLIDDLASRGTVVTMIKCDVRDKMRVIEVIKELSSERQVKGLVHAAVSVNDISFDKLSVEQWHDALAAKIIGTKNLHEATIALPLDFFVMTTSLVSLISLATQSAYAAANNFQDAFARYRHNLGLPASTISFGLVSDADGLGSNAATANTMARNKALTVTEHQLLTLIEPAFLSETQRGRSSREDWQFDPLSRTNIHTCMDPAAMAAKKREEAANGTAPGPSPRWYSDARVSHIMQALDDAYRHASDAVAAAGGQDGETLHGGSSGVARLRHEFNEAIKQGPEERSSTQALVSSAIMRTVADMLSLDAVNISETKCVAEYGVDSLIAAELRNWFNVAFKTNIPMLDLLDVQTSIKALAAFVVDKALQGAQQ